MNLNFFLTLFCVFYSKYSYCYEVSKNMPLRYFDGTEWKIMKSRTQTNLAPIFSNISIDLDWSKSNEGNKKTDKVTTTKNTVQRTTKSTTAKKVTIAVTKKVTQKVTKKVAQKVTKKVTQKVTKKVTPKVTKKVTPKIARKATTTKCNSCGSCYIKTTTKAVPRAIKWLTTKKSNVRTTKRSPPRTTKKLIKTTTKAPVKTIKKFPVKSSPAIFAKKYTAHCNERKGCLNESQALPENWVNVIKNFVDTLKNIENKKNNSQYETENEPKLNPEYPLVDGRRAMEGMEDIMNLLMDGVEIDDRQTDDETNTLDYNQLPGFKGMFENQDTILDLNETENLFAFRNWNTTEVIDPILNKNNLQNLDLESYIDATNALHVKKYGDKFQNRAIKAYIDLLKSGHLSKDALQYRDVPFDLNVINAVIETKRPDLEFREDAEYKDYFKETDLKTYLNAKNHASSSQNRNIKTYLDLIKSKLITRDNLQNSEALLGVAAVNPVTEIKNLKPFGEDKDLELYFQPYINKMFDKYETEKETISQDGSGSIAKNEDGFKGLDLRPYLNEMNAEYAAKNQDGFKGLDLGSYLNEMHVNYATKKQDSSEKTITKYRDNTLKTTSADLNEIAALIASKDTNSIEFNKYKNLLKDKHVQNLLKTLKRLQISKYKNSLRNSRETAFDTDETTKNEKNNFDAIESVDDENLYAVTSETVAAEENDNESDDYRERKQTDTNGDRELEGNGQMSNSFKYPLDDREQNEINEDYAFTWDGDGETFQMPKPRPTLAS